LRGAPLQANENTSMPASFLLEQMAWREDLDEAQTLAAVRDIDAAVATRESQLLDAVQDLLDQQGKAKAAAGQVRALMFIARFRADLRANIDRRLEALGQ
jgi:molecular chaperone HscB